MTNEVTAQPIPPADAPISIEDAAAFERLVGTMQAHWGLPESFGMPESSDAADGTPECLPPMRLRCLTLDPTLALPEEQVHISGCPRCLRWQSGVRAAYVLPNSDTLLRFALGDCDENEARLFRALRAESLAVRQMLDSPMFQNRVTLARRERGLAASRPERLAPQAVRSREMFPRLARVRQHADTPAARQQQLTFDDPRLNGSYHEQNETWHLHIEKRGRNDSGVGTLVLLSAPDADGQSEWFQYAVYGRDWRGLSLAADAPKALLAGRTLQVTEAAGEIPDDDAPRLWEGFVRQVAADEKRRADYIDAWQTWARIITAGAASAGVLQTARRILEEAPAGA